jgi:hypothetical protein
MKNVILQCWSSSDETKKKSITLYSQGNVWKQTLPAAPWLNLEQGIWSQASTAGVELKNPAGKKVGFFKGLNFANASQGDVGDAQFDISGTAGRWFVFEVVI